MTDGPGKQGEGDEASETSGSTAPPRRSSAQGPRAPSDSPVGPKPGSAKQAPGRPGGTKQEARSGSAQKTGSQKTGAQRTGGQKTGAQRTGAQKTGAQKTGAQKTGAPQTGGQKTGAQKQAGAKRQGTAPSRDRGASATATKRAAPGPKASAPSRKEAQRQGARRLPGPRSALSTRGAWAVAVGAFLLTVVDLPKIQYSDWAPETGVALIVGVAGLPLLAARAIGRGGSRRADSEVWAARLAIGFVLAGIVSAALSTSPSLAAFGLYQHGTGWIFMALLAGWWALGTGFGSGDRHLLETALIAGALVNAALAILQQLFNLTSLGLEGLSGQPDGFLGNPVFLGGLLAASLVLVAPRFAADPRRWWVAVAVIGLGLGVDGERLPALLAVVVVAWVAIAAWRARHEPQAGDQRWHRALEILGLTVGTVLVGSGLAKLRGGLGVVNHTASSSNAETFGQRLHAWRAAAHAFAHHPLLGSGPGQFRAATSAYFSAADVRADGSVLGTFPDAHNFIVEYATTTGIIGLGLLVAWLVFSVRGRSGPLLGFAAVIGALELAEPLNVVITPLAFLALGAAVLHVGGRADEKPAAGDRAGAAPTGPPRWVEPAGVVLAIVAAVAALLLVIGDISYESARADGVNSQYSAALPSAHTANTLLSPWSDPATLLGATYFALSNGSPSPDLTTAINWAKVAVSRDPTNPQSWATLAQYQGTAGDLDGARASALKSVSYQPTYPPALNVLGIVATQKHQNAQAEAWIQRSLAAEPGQRSEAKLLAELKKGCTALRLTAHAKGVQLNCPH